MSTKPAAKNSTAGYGKKFLLISVFVLTSFVANAQYFSDTLYYREPTSPPKAILKMDLFSPFRHFSAISFSLEHRLKPTLYLEHQIDYLTNIDGSSLSIDPIREIYTGFQLHSELRHYLDFKAFSKKGIYIAPKIMFGHVITEKEKTLRLDCGTGCEYFKRLDYDLRENLVGLLFKFGVQRIYKESIVIDYYFGLGYKTHAFKIIGPSESEKRVLILRAENRGLRRKEFENFTAATFSLGFKIGFVLK